MSDAASSEGGAGPRSLGGLMEEVCDRAEAAWKAGRPPRIEDELLEVPAPARAELLRSLLVLELAYRRRGGERPTPGEYRRRLPEHGASIDAAFGAETAIDRPRAGADSNLLFGLLAFQNNFIDREALLAAFAAWVADKSRPLGRILLARGAVDDGTYALLEALVRKHLSMHGDDPGRSLAALSTIGSALDDLERVADPDLQASLSRLATDRTTEDHDATQAHAPGRSGAAGLRFRVLRFHAKGGLGQVSVARDEELHRDVALKEIRDQYADDPDSRSRFVQEAEITGRLEHPGIIPVYGLGTYGDGRPFYAMRFIKGDNLMDAIGHFHEADAPGRDPGGRALALRELLRRFLDVCNAMAYAHSRGVLHRDLKPQNILLGPYGETLVVDWGLAKPIGRPEGVHGSGEETLRPESAGKEDATRAGSKIGTPGYMSPEQAAGQLDRLGWPSDVYSLGATLYCLLTGRAPFEGGDLEGRLEKVRRGEFPPPRAVIRAIGPALEAVCLKAMALRPEDRYATPGALAEDLERWLAGEPVSAWREPWAARALRRGRRHRAVASAAAAALLVAALAGGGFGIWVVGQNRERATRVRLALGEAVAARRRAEAGGIDAALWGEALAGTRRAQDLLGAGVEDRTRREVRDQRRDVEAASRQAAMDRILLARVVEIRGAKADGPDGILSTDAEYYAAFRSLGIDADMADPAGAGARLRARPVAVAVELAAALDDWAATRQRLSRDPARWSRLVAVARLADPDPRRDAIRSLLARTDLRAHRESLQDLAADAQEDNLPSTTVTLLADALVGAGAAGAAKALLSRALVRYPGDVWINYNLATLLRRSRPPQTEEAVRFYTAARAIQPETARALAQILFDRGQAEEAIGVARHLTLVRPDNVRNHICLGTFLRQKSLPGGDLEFAKAVALAREEVRLRPDDALAFSQLGAAVFQQYFVTKSEPTLLNEAITAAREAVRLKPNDAFFRTNLGAALVAKEAIDEAIIEYRAAVRLEPDYVPAHNNLAAALKAQGMFDEALAEYREAIRLDPDDALPRFNLGNLFAGRGSLEEAAAAYRAAIRVNPEYAQAHNRLGRVLKLQGSIAGAIAEFREACRLKGDYDLRDDLVSALADGGAPEDATADCREYIRRNPEYAPAHYLLGKTLRDQGKFVDALAAARRGHELGAIKKGLGPPFARLVQECERMVELDARLPAVLSNERPPADSDERLEFASLCSIKRLHAASAGLYGEAFAAEAKLADGRQEQHRYNAACAAALAGCGRGQDAPPLDVAARARLRGQAIDWLRAELAAWAKQVEAGPPEDRNAAERSLRHWRVDPDLAGLRDEESIGKLPQPERDALLALWADVAALLKKARDRPVSP